MATAGVVLTGVHLGSWGHDLTPPLHLRHLVQEILRHTDVPRLRLSSFGAVGPDAEFFGLWADGRLCATCTCRCQSGSAATLRRMARKTNPRRSPSLRRCSGALAIPGVAITTDVIAGFPAREARRVRESLELVHRMRLCRWHVFTYSGACQYRASRMPARCLTPCVRSATPTCAGLWLKPPRISRRASWAVCCLSCGRAPPP